MYVVTWLWGDRYGVEEVAKLAAGFRRNLKRPHRFVCFSDREFWARGVEVRKFEDKLGLTKIKGCFTRLQMFDSEFQAHNFLFVDQVVCVDLDTIATGKCDSVFDRKEDFVILSGGNASNPCPFNGALLSFRPGTNHQLWDDFSLDRIKDIPKYEFPDDQGWYAQQLPNAATWKAGPNSNVYVFGKPGWPKGSEDLPNGARLVTFVGAKEPKKFTHLSWVRENWVYDGA